MSIFRNMTVRSAGILFVFSLLSGCGGGGGSAPTAPTVNPADVIGTWKMVSHTPPGGGATDASSYNISLVSDASTYTIVYPVAIPGNTQTPCTEYGTWSVSGNNLNMTPIAGSTCGNTASTLALSISGSTMTVSDADGTAAFQKQTANPVTGGTLVGTWKVMAIVDAGALTPMSQISTTVTLNASAYSISLPNCTETGTWSASGNTLSFSVDPASTCGSSSTYTETVYWNDPLLTLNLSSTTQDIIWQKQLDAPASPAATVTNGAVDISWQAVSGATGYKVYRGTVSGTLATKTLIGSPYGNAWRDVTAAAGTAYYYQVTAVGASGESTPSAEVGAVLTPSPVTGLTATPGTGQVTLSWNAVSGADSYNVYHYTTGIGMCQVFVKEIGTNYYSLTGWTNLGAVLSAGANVTGTSSGICHQFMVTAVNAAGESLSMSYVNATPN